MFADGLLVYEIFSFHLFGDSVCPVSPVSAVSGKTTPNVPEKILEQEKRENFCFFACFHVFGEILWFDEEKPILVKVVERMLWKEIWNLFSDQAFRIYDSNFLK